MLNKKIQFKLIANTALIALLLAACQAAPTTAGPATAAPATVAPATVAPATAAPATTAPVATATPPPTDTATPAPVATQAPAATATSAPVASSGTAQVTPSINAYCRKGPGTGYFSMTYLTKGSSYSVVGQNGVNTWWLVQATSSITCWVGDPNASLAGPVDQAPTVIVPPLPGMPGNFVRTRTCDPSSNELTVAMEWAPVDNITGYSIYRNGNLLVQLQPGITSYVDTTPGDTDLTYDLQAFNDYGASPSLEVNAGACSG
jgi:hypothetical protein